jgi:hypothetical protein
MSFVDVPAGALPKAMSRRLSSRWHRAKLASMPRRELKEALSALHEELESGAQIEPDDRDALVRAMQEIHEALDETNPSTEPATGGPLSARVSELIEEFETSHPKFAKILSSVSESLANLGI